MSVLAFELRSNMAHFRRPDTMGTHASYPFITRTALHGLIASILGLELLPESPRCGIRLIQPVRTVAHEMSMLGKGWMGSSGQEFNRPTAIEIVVNPHYRVYYQGALQEELEGRLKEGRSHYHTYLGSAYCLTFPAFHASYSDTEVKSLTPLGHENMTCVSVVPSETVSRLMPQDEDEYARVGGILYEHLGNRRFEGSISLIYEVQGGPITFTPVAASDTDKWSFLDLPDEGVVCLW